MSDKILNVKYKRVTRQIINGVIKRDETILELPIERKETFYIVKQKYWETFGLEDVGKESVKFSFRWYGNIPDEETLEELGYEDGDYITVDYSPFIRDNKINLDEFQSALMAGIHDKDSHLYSLRGCPHVIENTCRLLSGYWKRVIQFPSKLTVDHFSSVGFTLCNDYFVKSSHPDAFFLAPIYPDHNFFGENDEKKIHFPKPSGININMMPFVLQEEFKDCKLPEFVKPYWQMIETCIRPDINKIHHHMWRNKYPTEIGKICYLTIQETAVKKNRSQRRPGLHVDNPCSIKIINGCLDNYSRGDGHSNPYKGHNWGSGGSHIINTEGPWDRLNFVVMTGGIYMASSSPNTCKAWDCKIVPDQWGKEVIGRLGDIEHLQHLLPDGQILEANQIYWMTDRTPHESLPLPEGGQRQFFRLVTSQVSIWYRDHSTTNPLGVMPDPSITRVVKGDKFSDEGVEFEI